MSEYVFNCDKIESCVKCPFLCENNYCSVLRSDIRLDQQMNKSCCPLNELPESHGRLKDADVATNEIRKLFCEKCKTKNDSDKCWTCRVHSCIRIIDDEPTVLEASE